MKKKQLEEERKREIQEKLVAPFTWRAFLLESVILSKFSIIYYSQECTIISLSNAGGPLPPASCGGGAPIQLC